MNVQYKSHQFSFDASPQDSFHGRLLLTEEQRVLLSSLLAAEDEDWDLDDDGERRPAEELFELSPWSARTPDGPRKLLCRFIDLRNGTVLFSTLESYPGDSSSWARSTPQDAA